MDFSSSQTQRGPFSRTLRVTLVLQELCCRMALQRHNRCYQ